MPRKLRRWLASASGPSLPFLAVCIAILGLLSKATIAQTTDTQGISTILLYALIVLGAMAWLMQTQFEYQRRTYDSTLARRYQQDWLDAKNERAKAAKILLEQRDKLTNIKEYAVLLDPIDDVLDILEDLGFYLRGDQMSPEVAHHFFYHWIRGYWYAARPYIEARRRIESPIWENLRLLFDETSAIESAVEESGSEKLSLDATQIESFLDEELRYGRDNA